MYEPIDKGEAAKAVSEIATIREQLTKRQALAFLSKGTEMSAEQTAAAYEIAAIGMWVVMRFTR